MEDIDIIRGKRIFDLLEELKNDKTFIKMHLLGEGWERLTCVTDIRVRRGDHYLLIDYPEGFRELVAHRPEWELRFDFVGKDKLSHRFKTFGVEISGSEIWCKFPEMIERVQRRRDFRERAPEGTKIVVQIDSTEHAMSVVNISQGGALVSVKKTSREKSILNLGKYLRGLGIVFPFEDEIQKVDIQVALVKRVGEDPRKDYSRYGLQFTRVESPMKNILRNLIYRIQRMFLRKRDH